MKNILAIVVILFAVASASANTGYWSVDADGNWNDAGNWTNTATPPNGTGDVAFVTTELTAERTVTLENDVILGELIVGNDGYRLGGSSIATTEKIIFQNGENPSTLSIINLDNRKKETKFYRPIQVEDTLNVDFTQSANVMAEIRSGFMGNSNSVVNITYYNTAWSATIKMREMKNFYGTMNLYRPGSDVNNYGFTFYDANSFPSGGSGSVKVNMGVGLLFRTPLTDSDAALFDYVGVGQQITLDSNGTFDNLTNPTEMIPDASMFRIMNSTSSTLTHYPDGKSMNLNNVYLSLSGYNSGSGYVNIETPGKLTIENGNTIYVDSTTKENSKAGFDFSDFERMGSATLTVGGKGNGSPTGTTESNRVTFAANVTSETNGILPPYIIYYDQSNSTNGMFAAYGTHGIKPFDSYDAENDFSQGAAAVVAVDEAVDLGGGSAECYALRCINQIVNGDLTIHSGGLIMGSAFKNYTANLYFGDSNGTGNAYLFLDGHTDKAKALELRGEIHCKDFVKFGNQPGVALTASNSISGRVELQVGGITIRNKYAFGCATNLYMGYNAKLILWSGDGEYIVGGLDSPGKSYILPYSAATEHLIVVPYENTTVVFNGDILDDSGKVAVTVDGPGTQVFGGNNDYTGDTIITSGSTLILNGKNSATGSVYVADSGIFGGTGSMNGLLNLQTNTTLKLQPTEPLTVGSIDFSEASVLTIDVSDVDILEEGVALQWTTDVGSSLPALNLLGAPIREDGKYVAQYDLAEDQIEVIFSKTYGSLFIIE